MSETIEIRRERDPKLPALQAFYTSVGYQAPIAGDCICLSARAGDEIVGLVRLAPEAGDLWLRGMMIAPAYQRQGIGGRMLDVLSELIGTRECYCLPHAWLDAFYGRIGFRIISETGVPARFAERLRLARDRGYDIILMHRPAWSAG
jgi:GNAT superfamily N-acetyltransferase